MSKSSSDIELKWPPNCGFDSVGDPIMDEPPLGPSNPELLRRDISRLRAELLGSDRRYLTREEELELARQIQDASVAEELLRAEAGDPDLEATVQQGQQARMMLFAANVEFARFVARASMNIVKFSKNGTKRGGDLVASDENSSAQPVAYVRRSSRVGSYDDIRQLASDAAELSDRTQVAFEAMWKATESYKPSSGEGVPGASFVTYSLYGIQQAIDRYSREREGGGWYLSTNTLSRIIAAKRAVDVAENASGRPISTNNRPRLRFLGDGLTGQRHDYLDPRTSLEGRRTIGFGAVSFGLIPEESDVYRGEVRVTPEEIIPDNGEPPESGILWRQFKEQLYEALGTLSTMEESVIAMRFGLTDGVCHTLDEIGKQHGVTRERIRQIETKAISKLRHPSRSESLKPFLDAFNDGVRSGEERVLGDTNFATLNVKTRRVIATRPNERPAIYDPSWQIDAWDEWDAPVHQPPEETVRYLQTEGVRLSHVLGEIILDELQGFLSGDVAVLKTISTRSLEGIHRAYAPLYIEYVWNNCFAELVENIALVTRDKEEATPFNLDNLVGVFNHLINNVTDSSYTLTLGIPEGFEGKLNGIGRGLHNGMLVVEGDVGEGFGQDAGKGSYLVLNGNAGDLVGCQAQSDAQIYIRGSVGDFCGAGISGRDVVIEVEGNAGEDVGYDAKRGKVIVRGSYASCMPNGAIVTGGIDS